MFASKGLWQRNLRISNSLCNTMSKKQLIVEESGLTPNSDSIKHWSEDWTSSYRILQLFSSSCLRQECLRHSLALPFFIEIMTQLTKKKLFFTYALDFAYWIDKGLQNLILNLLCKSMTNLTEPQTRVWLQCYAFSKSMQIFCGSGDLKNSCNF